MYRPVPNPAPWHIPTTQYQIGLFGQKARNVIGIMGEVSIHLDDALCPLRKDVLESSDIRTGQSSLTLSLEKEDTAEFPVQIPDDIGCAIGRTIVNDEDLHPL